MPAGEITFPTVAINIRKPKDDVSFYIHQYNNAATAFWPHRLRCIRNTRVYASVGADQWQEGLLSTLRREGREPESYNFAQFIVDGVAGNYVMNWFDPKFNDREDDDKDVQNGVTSLQKKYYADKKRWDFKASALRSIRDGCIYGGWEEMVIDKTVDPRGTPYFEPVRADFIVPDMLNLSDQISRKAKELYKEFLLTAEEMFMHYPHADKDIHEAVKGYAEQAKFNGKVYDRIRVDTFGGAPYMHGSKYTVVEWYHFEYEPKKKILDKTTLQEYPDFGLQFGTPEDFHAKGLYAQQRGWNPADMVVTERRMPVLWVTTFCKDLGILLDNRRDLRQLDGKLPFYFWGFMMINGVSIGIMDLIMACQRDLNKRETAKTKYLTQTPLGGKMWFHPTAFGGPGEKLNQAIENMTDSSKPMVLDPNVPEGLSQSLFGIMNGMQINPAIFQDEDKKIEFMSKIGRLPPAMQGITEKSGESGIHMGRKVIEGSIMQRVPMEFLLQKEKHKAVDWVKMNIMLCGGDGDKRNWLANLNRKFRGVDGEEVIMNEVIAVDNTGMPTQVKSDISKLKHVEVDITESKENDFVRQMKRETTVASLQAVPPSPENDMIRAEMEAELVTNLDHATSDARERAEEAAALRRKIANVRAKLVLISTELELIEVQKAYNKTVQEGLDAVNQAGGAQPSNKAGQPGPRQPNLPEELTKQPLLEERMDTAEVQHVR